MGILATLTQLVEPWATLYGDSPAVRTVASFAHFGGFLLGGGFAITADAATIRAARGREPRRRRQLAYIHGVHRWVLGGLALTIASGLLMLAADLETLATSAVFWAKMLLVILLVTNGGAITLTEATLRRGAADEDRQWRRMRNGAVRSMALWFAAVLAGALLVNPS